MYVLHLFPAEETRFIWTEQNVYRTLVILLSTARGDGVSMRWAEYSSVRRHSRVIVLHPSIVYTILGLRLRFLIIPQRHNQKIADTSIIF